MRSYGLVPFAGDEVRAGEEVRIFNIHGDRCHSAHGLTRVIDAVRIDGILTAELLDEMDGPVQFRPVLIVVIDDDRIVLRGQDEAGVLGLPFRRGEGNPKPAIFSIS